MKKNLLTLCTVVLCIAANAQYTKLLDFNGTTNGERPRGALFYDGTFLYGTTGEGGLNDSGVVFKLKPDGTAYTKLMDFGGLNGTMPLSTLISDGVFLYGATFRGGTNNLGTLYKIKPDGTGFSTLHDFDGTATGANPYFAPIFDGSFLYGTTPRGGTGTCDLGCGTIYKIKPDGTEFTKLYDMEGDLSGRNTYASLISDGTFLYGSAQDGGLKDSGVVFRIKLDGTEFTKLHDFGGVNGSSSAPPLISDGTFLYGTTYYGGTTNNGVIFRMKPDGTEYTRLLNFDGISKGKNPISSLVFGGSFLYGMTAYGGTNNLGVMFKIKSDGTAYSKLIDFDGANGRNPYNSLIIDGTVLYGMTLAGGSSNRGVIFKYNTLNTGLEEHNLPLAIAVSPNPFANEIMINSTTEKGEVVLYDISGNEVLKQKSSERETTINTESLAQGFYILHYTEGGKTANMKLVRQ